MTIRETLGHSYYEQLREAVERAFPGPDNEVTDEAVDAFIVGLQRQGAPGVEKLGLGALPPPPAEDDTPVDAGYPLYVAHIHHHRDHEKDSRVPMRSEFDIDLAMVRVPLPPRLTRDTRRIKTAIGDVELERDHKIPSVQACVKLYAEELGYTPARMDLITSARKHGLRLALNAIYLGYRATEDTAPSFYVLEWGLITGQARVLHLGKTIDGVIDQPTDYKPTPFTAKTNSYRSQLFVQNDQPVRLDVRASAPNLPSYIDVKVDYERTITVPKSYPGLQTVEAVERVAAIGRAMGARTGIPAPVEEVLADIALRFLPWVAKPQAPGNPKPAPLGPEIIKSLEDGLKERFKKRRKKRKRRRQRLSALPLGWCLPLRWLC
jgi:hypothetical protein